MQQEQVPLTPMTHVMSLLSQPQQKSHTAGIKKEILQTLNESLTKGNMWYMYQ